MTAPTKLKIRPYDRLLTMLGDQLIKNERIALIELLKNSYDADADWAKVTFDGFGQKLSKHKASKIIIEDNGDGMSEQIIRKAWMNPATSHKKHEKRSGRRTESGRVIQGEKGIGRFSALKIGRHIKVTTRPRGCVNEYVIEFNFSDYDDEFTKYRGKKKELFLDGLHATLVTQKPKVFKSRTIKMNGRRIKAGQSGTRIEIQSLKGSWSEKKLKEVTDDVLKLQSIFSRLFPDHEDSQEMQFEVGIAVGDEEEIYQTKALDDFKALMENTSVLQVKHGSFDAKALKYNFVLNGKDMVLDFDDLRGDRWCHSQFGRKADKDKRIPTCGSFKFSFYVFDLKADPESLHYLSREEVNLIKPHRVYLYRDGIRVYPYGEKEDDWLSIDILRGTVSAAAFLSNDQVIGCVNITYEGNPSLRDKTSREGLIEEGDATTDFTAVLRTFLSYLRSKPFARYRQDVEKRRLQRALKEGKADKAFSALFSYLDNKGDDKTYKIAKKVERACNIERSVYEQRVKTTEELAVVGIAVETSSHDLMLMMGKTLDEMDALINVAMKNGGSCKNCLGELQKMRGMLSFIEHRMKDIQTLFKSSKQKRHRIRVREILDKVAYIYKTSFEREGIEIDIQDLGSPLIANCTDAVLMQLFINLFDNSLYWLKDVPKKERLIHILLDGNDCRMVFADSGPGVRADDKPYIFDAYYSGKGEEGRGLGLYIAQQLLERLDYSIELLRTSKESLLPGANFSVSFVGENQ